IGQAHCQKLKDRYRLMCYNVENLFDTINNPNTADDEFTPRGSRAWNDYKLRKKISNIYKVIAAVGEGNPPDIIGFCEIENRSVIEMIITQTPLRYQGYEIIHQESQDRRGIDVGLIYRKDRFWPLEERFFAAVLDDSGRVSRDILYTKGLILNSDTLHIFVNHWPSKYGGAVATRPLRDSVALTLRRVTDSILDSNPKANIIITGDLNTDPDDEAIKHVLQAANYNDRKNSRLVNMTTAVYPSKYKGTHKYQGIWSCIDHWIVSQSLIDDSPNPTKTSAECVYIGDFDFLTEEDRTHQGKKPFRTYVGFSYNGGYSDHYPIYIDLLLYTQEE
ncbi:MAG TPA: endonuclease, partial [Salinivirgaceae bacterium]|nr:endonuclease [Salinivirgaceae bacterium]